MRWWICCNANRTGAAVISSGRARVRVFVISTDEAAMIVRHMLAVFDREAKKQGR
jgi:acetate kinase